MSSKVLSILFFWDRYVGTWLSTSELYFWYTQHDLFLEFQGVSELAEKLVNTGKYGAYPLVYLLVKLALTLPVATATV